MEDYKSVRAYRKNRTVDMNNIISGGKILRVKLKYNVLPEIFVLFGEKSFEAVAFVSKDGSVRMIVGGGNGRFDTYTLKKGTTAMVGTGGSTLMYKSSCELFEDWNILNRRVLTEKIKTI